MGGILSSTEIAALVEAASQGERREEAAHGARRRRLRPVDFARPGKFTAEQERRILRALDTFCQTAATRLSAELRIPLELEVLDTSQLAWSSAQAALPPESVGAPLTASPIDTRMLLTVELPFVLRAIEHLLGGAPERAPEPRKLSEIDWVLTRRLFATLTQQLSVVWHDLADLSLDLQQVDTHTEGMQIAPVSEPTLTVTLEARVDGDASTLALLIPWAAIEPVADRVAGRDATQPAADPRVAAAVQDAISTAQVTLRAQIGGIELAIDDVLALAPGDLVRLGVPVDAGVAVCAEDVPVHRAKPGRSGTRRAVQVLPGPAVSPTLPSVATSLALAPARTGAAPGDGDGEIVFGEMADVRVRVWAELGRVQVPLGRAPELPPGAVVELDRRADDPVEMFVNGLAFASGRLEQTDDGEWALRVAALHRT